MTIGHGDPRPTKTKQAPLVQPSGSTVFVDFAGKLIYNSRLGLVPMYLMFLLVIALYGVQLVQDIVFYAFTHDHHFNIFAIFQHDGPERLLFVLSLIDAVMIGELMVMVTVGGFNTFVKEYKFSELGGKPRWMNGLDSSTLKIKMSMSLVAVTAIHLLKTFMEVGNPAAHHEVTWNTLGMEMAIHAMFIGTTVFIAWVANMLHAHHPAATDTNATTSGADFHKHD
jgi:uncharacterized protein (TIGR00645 family)